MVIGVARDELRLECKISYKSKHNVIDVSCYAVVVRVYIFFIA